MTIETKFNIGQIVWFIHEGKAYFGEIKQIFFDGVMFPSNNIKCDLSYEVWHRKDITDNGYIHLEENLMFESKADLLNSL